MTKDQVIAHIESVGIIPAIRVASAADALFAAAAVASGGIPIVELTMTVAGAIDAIAELHLSRPDILIGAGTVLSADVAHRCLDAGAAFITSTGFDPEVMAAARSAGAAVIPGALTPTEVIAAWKAGADCVKIFPCSMVGGPAYIRALRAPFPQIKLIASGGVNQQTASEFIFSGASALGIGGDLIPRESIQHRQPGRIRELARRFVKMVKEARLQLAS